MDQIVPFRGKSGVFKRDRIADLIAAAKAIPDKSDTKDELTVGELIPKLWPAIGKMMGKQYSYKDIAHWMIENGVAASQDTLITAIGDEVRKRGKGRGINRSTPTDNHTGKTADKKPRVIIDKKRGNDSALLPAKSRSNLDETNGSSKQVPREDSSTPNKVSQLGRTESVKTSAAFEEDV